MYVLKQISFLHTIAERPPAITEPPCLPLTAVDPDHCSAHRRCSSCAIHVSIRAALICWGQGLQARTRRACLICELCKAWLVSQAQASHDLARSVQGSLFDFVAALEPVLALSVFDLHLAARPNHNPRYFPIQNRSRELARARPRKNEMEERAARAKRESKFCFPVTRLGNSSREIKQRLLHPTGSAARFWLISNTPVVAGGDVAGLFAWLSKPYRFALWILYHIDLGFLRYTIRVSSRTVVLLVLCYG
jgi:hypothetical protein